jgi:SSS family solute:Na+ symporter
VNTVFGHSIYIGLTAIIINLGVSVILTLIFKAVRVPEGADETAPREYTADPPEAPAAAPAGVGVGSAGAAGDLPRRR